MLNKNLVICLKLILKHFLIVKLIHRKHLKRQINLLYKVKKNKLVREY